MRAFCYLLLIPLFIHLSNASIVEDTCKNISTSHPNIAYDFCVNSFESYEHSLLAADQRTLAIIASRLANSTAVKTVARIQELMEEEKNQPRRNRLDSCMEVPFYIHLNIVFFIFWEKDKGLTFQISSSNWPKVGSLKNSIILLSMQEIPRSNMLYESIIYQLAILK